MDSFKILTDSASDIPLVLREKYDISVIGYYLSFDGTKYLRDGIDITVRDFYKTMRERVVYPKTSQPNLADFISFFQPYVEKSIPVLYINLTSKFSASYVTALNAKQLILEDFPNAKIEIVDSKLAAFPQGFLALECARMREAGFSYEEVKSKVPELIKGCRAFITVDSLEYLQRGGRIGKVSAMAGSLLNIKPVIVLESGELIPYHKVRGRKKTVSKLIEMLMTDLGDKPSNYRVTVIHADCYDEALELADLLRNQYNIEIEEPVPEIGIVIGSHIGPSVLGLIYIKKFVK